MENFLTSRPTIAKAAVPPKTTANLFASLANRASARPGALSRSDTVAAQASTDSPCERHEPQIELIREGGAVQRIVVVCKCGERIELECVY